tara:strand:+ start:134 stop:337 length:204 start_codon:yes stop_codon:yes gene_type:complete
MLMTGTKAVIQRTGFTVQTFRALGIQAIRRICITLFKVTDQFNICLEIGAGPGSYFTGENTDVCGTP